MATTSTKKAQWTVLGYLAGDNNLEGAAIEDINEMEEVGSTDRVNVVVQVDRAADYNQSNGNWRTTRRYYITRGADRRKITSKLLKDLGETNTGDSRFLQDFMRFGVQDYPAERYLLVLWNHGSGFYVPPEMMTGEGAPSPREMTTRARAKMRRSFFHATRQEIFAQEPRKRGICYDDGSSDCLDNRELQQVLAYMQTRLGGRKIDVVGMDACLMTMLEVAYQIRNQAAILVGSEEVEPGDGWPYDRILADLAAKPTMRGTDLAKSIVTRYIESYEKPGPFDEDVTQAALDLSKLGDITAAVDALAKALLKKLPSVQTKGAIVTAWQQATRFFDNYYVDLHHFAENLGRIAGNAGISTACQGVKNAIDGRGAASPILWEGHSGQGMVKAKGLSIYMPPLKNPSDYYRTLDFASATKWADFLDAYLK